MKVISNQIFAQLAEDQSPRLKSIAKDCCVRDPNGYVTLQQLEEYSKACEYSGDHKASRWLKNLMILSKNGTITRIRTGKATWEDHVAEVRALHATKDIPFDIGQHIFVKDCGRYGSIADYIPDTKEYLVVLDPFQLRTYKKNELQKVAEAHVVYE
jgi:hypothetical protein